MVGTKPIIIFLSRWKTSSSSVLGILCTCPWSSHFDFLPCIHSTVRHKPVRKPEEGDQKDTNNYHAELQWQKTDIFNDLGLLTETNTTNCGIIWLKCTEQDLINTLWLVQYIHFKHLLSVVISNIMFKVTFSTTWTTTKLPEFYHFKSDSSLTSYFVNMMQHIKSGDFVGEGNCEFNSLSHIAHFW